MMIDKDRNMRKLGADKLSRMTDIQKVWHPEWFQGRRRRNNYFEGWYMKHVSSRGEHILSFIPGVSLSSKDPHAFVQGIDGHTGQTWYFRYPADAFHYAPDAFDIRIGNSRFSKNSITLDLESPEERITGEIRYANLHTFPVSLRTPGIMGWYRYVPAMQCYHGVVSLDHDLAGSIQVNGKDHDFSGGKGYVEKDWGSSMPEAWIWMQSNHFPQQQTSFMLSIARVPWLRSSFPGFLGFFLHDGQPHYFATYTGAKIRNLEISKREVSLRIDTKDKQLHIRGEKKTGGSTHGALKAPGKGHMERVIHENVNASLFVLLADKQGKVLFEGEGRHAGLEMIGDTSILQG